MAEGDIIPIIADGDDGELEDVEVPETIPILSLRNTVLFPGVVLQFQSVSQVNSTN